MEKDSYGAFSNRDEDNASTRFVTNVRPGRKILLAALVVLAATAPAFAQAPDVSSFTPSGAKRGTTTTLKWIGDPGKEPVSARSTWPGLKFETGAKQGELVLHVAPEAPSGVAEVWVYTGLGYAVPRPLFVGDAAEVAEIEPNDHWRKPQALVGGEGQPTSYASGVAVTGLFNKAGDADVFAVPLEAGSTFVATLESRRLDAPADPVIQIVSPAGFVLEQNDDDHGFDPLLAFTATESGVHFVRVFAFPATPDTAIRLAGGANWAYRLTLSTGPVASHALPLGRPGPNAAGEAVPDAPFEVGLVGWNLPGGAAPTAAALAPFALPEGWPAPPVPFPKTGLPSPAYPTILSFGRLIPAPAGARLAVEPPDGQPRDLGNLPGCVSGTISRGGETDQYGVVGVKGQSLRVRVLAREFDSLLDPVVRVLGPDGKPLREVDDEGRGEVDVDFVQAVAADGPLSIVITDRYGHGGPRYHYRLDVEAARPDVVLSLPAARHAFKPGATAEVVVDLKREQGYDKPVVVKAVGLPAGVTCDDVTSPGKGDAAKQVKLVLKSTADAVPFTGPIHFVGHVEGEAPRPALRPATPLLGSSPDVWLTVAPK